MGLLARHIAGWRHLVAVEAATSVVGELGLVERRQPVVGMKLALPAGGPCLI